MIILIFCAFFAVSIREEFFLAKIDSFYYTDIYITWQRHFQCFLWRLRTLFQWPSKILGAKLSIILFVCCISFTSIVKEKNKYFQIKNSKSCENNQQSLATYLFVTCSTLETIWPTLKIFPPYLLLFNLFYFDVMKIRVLSLYIILKQI